MSLPLFFAWYPPLVKRANKEKFVSHGKGMYPEDFEFIDGRWQKRFKDKTKKRLGGSSKEHRGREVNTPEGKKVKVFNLHSGELELNPDAEPIIARHPGTFGDTDKDLSKPYNKLLAQEFVDSDIQRSAEFALKDPNKDVKNGLISLLPGDPRMLYLSGPASLYTKEDADAFYGNDADTILVDKKHKLPQRPFPHYTPNLEAIVHGKAKALVTPEIRDVVESTKDVKDLKVHLKDLYRKNKLARKFAKKNNIPLFSMRYFKPDNTDTYHGYDPSTLQRIDPSTKKNLQQTYDEFLKTL